VARQCALLGLARSTYYARALPVGRPVVVRGRQGDEILLRVLDEQYLRTPFYGTRRMVHALGAQGYSVGRKRVRRLMGVLGIEALGPRPCTSRRATGHRIWPYLLRGVAVERPGQVFSSDITYVPMRRGHVYLVAVLDWASRYVLSWSLSTTLDVLPCLDALDGALAQHTPEIFNTDQGAQFTSQAFTGRLLERGIRISMDGKGRALDNVFIERLWRSVKYEEVYPNAYDDIPQLRAGLDRYFQFYNHRRPHQALGYKTPAEVWNNRERGGEGETAPPLPLDPHSPHFNPIPEHPILT
jgi:putative transposase